MTIWARAPLARGGTPAVWYRRTCVRWPCIEGAYSRGHALGDSCRDPAPRSRGDAGATARRFPSSPPSLALPLERQDFHIEQAKATGHGQGQDGSLQTASFQVHAWTSNQFFFAGVTAKYFPDRPENGNRIPQAQNVQGPVPQPGPGPWPTMPLHSFGPMSCAVKVLAN